MALACWGCRRPATGEAVAPVSLRPAAADGTHHAAADTAPAGGDAAQPLDGKGSAGAAAAGGLWVVDAQGKPVGVLVQRGHPSLSSGSGIDLLRDGALVYIPSAGVFLGLQMSTGLIIRPRLGVDDSACSKPLVAGYYTDSDAISGPAYAFPYNGQWYRVDDYQPLVLVTCGGTVADGVAGKCAPHNGTCRGFAVKPFATQLPQSFEGPLQLSWMAP